jgi:DNA-binding LacI/PurR family transcriptional regulator
VKSSASARQLAFSKTSLDRLPWSVHTDLEATGALRAIEAAGLTAGHDVSVIGHDDLPEAALTDPPLATLRQPHAEVGKRLA